jgi:serralysin
MHKLLPRRPGLLPMLLVFLCHQSFTPVANAFILGQNTRWTSTAASSATGTYGQPITLTWSLAPSGTAISSSYGTIGTTNNLISTFDTAFGGSPSPAVAADLTQRPWFHLFSDSFNRWSQLGGINFVYEPHDTTLTVGSSSAGQLGVRGDIRIGGTNFDGTNGTLAATLFPNNGDIVIDTADNSFFSGSSNNYRAFRDTLMHEVGHAFGLEHVISDTSHLLMAPVIDLSFDGPQLDEVRAIQYFYGDANEKSHNGQGNNTATLATPLGALATGGSVEVGSSARPDLVVNPGDTDFVSVFSNTDADYYSFNVSAATKLSAVLSPRGGIFTQTSQATPQPAPTTFNANNRSDLTLTLFGGANGTTQLALVNNAAAGLDETLNSFTLPSAGTYFVRVTGATADSVQLYDLKLSAAAAIAALTGDYNHDGVVDAADYTVWRDELGQTGSGLAADGNNDNTVNETDYNLWQSDFGHTSPGGGSLASTAVPEPSTAAMAIAPIALLLMRRTRRRQNRHAPN